MAMPRDINVDAVMEAFNAAHEAPPNPIADQPALVNPPDVPQAEAVPRPPEVIPPPLPQVSRSFALS